MNDEKRCTTAQGRYRCKKERGHKGDCEADDEVTWRFGPYRDSFRGRAYLRGRLEMAAGADLDVIGDALLIKRADSEDDCTYRERIWRTA